MIQSKKLKPIIASIILIIVIVAMFFAYQNLKPQTTQGSKKIVVEVVIPDKKAKTFTLHTDAKYLRQPLEENKLVKGKESEYGLFIQAVNGLKANDSKQEWWCVTKNKATLNTGVDTTPITDGDHFEITLKTGYDTN